MSDSKPIGIALLGAGIFARTAHLPALKAQPQSPLPTTLRAIYSRSSKSSSALAELASSELGYAVDHYAEDVKTGEETKGLKKLLERDDVEVVIVALPITVQPEVVLQALEAGKHVLCEKPIGPSVKAAQALIAEYKKRFEPKGLHFRIAENYEVEPGYLAARDVIREGTIGEVSFFRLTAVGYIDEKDNPYYHTPWRTHPEYEGGFLLDGGVHSAAVLRTILPSKPASLSAYASLTREILAPHDTIHAVIQLEASPNASPNAKPAHGIFELSFAAPDPNRTKPGQGSGFFVTGTKGWLSVVNTKKEGKPYIRVEVYVNKGGDEPKVVIEERNQGIEREIEHFVRLVSGKETGGGVGVGTLEGALSDVALIEAGLTSQGRPVALI